MSSPCTPPTPPPPTTQKFCVIGATSVRAEHKTPWLNFLVKEQRTNTHTQKASEHFPRHFQEHIVHISEDLRYLCSANIQNEEDQT